MNSELDNIINICNYISRSKSAEEIDIVLIEELSELIKVVTKLARWTFGDEFLRCDYKDIMDNAYEELADVIIMIIQFIDKNGIEYNDLANKMCEKISRYFETKTEEK